MPSTDAKRAKAVADRLRHLISEQTFTYQETNVQITISIGVAVFDDQKDTLDDLINRADSALYMSKRMGKNRLEIA